MSESTTHMDISIPYAEVEEPQLQIRVGACKLSLRPGATSWVAGTYTDPTGSIPCRIVQEAGMARVTQEPRLGALATWTRGTPAFDLALGGARPYALTVETGASETEIELGGLPLTRLSLRLGAGKHTVRFLEPNPRGMALLNVDAGAGAIELRGLANANFTEMTLDGGAAAFVCDFGGQLQRQAMARISTGVSTVEIRVPRSTAAHILPDVTLGHLQTSDGFTTREGGYWTPAALEPASPVLTIRISAALGMLQLQLSNE